MNKKICYIFLITVFGLVISGCSQYNLDLNYNKEDKMTTINITGKEYKLFNSILVGDNLSGQGFNKGSISTLQIFSEDEICKNILYRQTQRLENRMYYTSSAYANIIEKFRTKCKSEAIKGLDFHECGKKSAITKDVDGEFGIIQKKYLIISDKKCFYKLKELVLSDDKNKIKLSQKKYIGTFTAESNIEKCGTGGDLILYISPSNIINGKAKYTYKDKKVSTKLWGEVNNEEFHGETRNVKFYGNYNKDLNYITGEYFNRSCKGTFKVKLVNN